VAVLIIALKVRPRAAHNAVTGITNNAAGQCVMEIDVTAQPKDNESNEAVLKTLADHLDVPKTSLRLHRGSQSRHKRVELTIHDDKTRSRIETILQSGNNQENRNKK